MELTKRITYLSFLLIGILFILIGFALNELDVIAQVNQIREAAQTSRVSFDEWYGFLETWLGNENDGGFTQGLPVPWEE
jgi:hypothetical protein